ncbi:MAG: MFS transporter [Pseudomonadota bacterium]
MSSAPLGQIAAPSEPYRATGYSYYVLFILFTVYVLNYADRNILSILGEDVKRDLGLSDSQLGFLYGTAFAVFYSLFGIALGRLADVWVRVRLLTIGLSFWSAMTLVCGLAGNFGQLAAARVGVGIGEASAAPAGYSMLSDYFPKKQRGMALAFYSSGIFVGSGLAFAVGGEVVEWWSRAFTPETRPFGLRGWQAAFFVIGFPGLVLALVCAFLKEPVRGLSDGITSPPHPRPFRAAFSELFAVLPVTSFVHQKMHGASFNSLFKNALFALFCALAAAALTWLFAGRDTVSADAQQWTAIAIGVYCVFSWAQGLARRDAPTFVLIWQNPAFVLSVLAIGTIAMVGYSVGFWTPIYAIRVLELPRDEVGWVIGFGSAITGWIGISVGGPLADYWCRYSPRGRLYVIMLSVVLSLPLGLATFTAENTAAFYTLAVATNFSSTMWIGPAAANCQDLVLPRMRGVASASYLLSTTLIGLGLGPYMVGKISVETGNLQSAIMLLYTVPPVTLILLIFAAKVLPKAEQTRLERAKAAGEVLL